MESKGTTELLTSKAREGVPLLCELLVFNSLVSCISSGSYGLLIIASSHQYIYTIIHRSGGGYSWILTELRSSEVNIHD